MAINGTSLLCALFFLFFLSCSLNVSVSAMEPLRFPNVTGSAQLNGHYMSTISAPSTKMGAQCVLSYTCPQPEELTSKRYNELLQALYQKGLNDTLIAYYTALEKSRSSVSHTLEAISTYAASLFRTSLWTVVFLLSSTMWGVTCLCWMILYNFTAPVFALASLICSLVCIRAFVKWIFGLLPSFVGTAILYVPRMLYRGVSSKGSLSEKSTVGFISHPIPCDPPKKSVLPLQYPDGSHLGYANCIQLYNGERALLTAHHCWVKDALVASPKTGNRIPLSQFRRRISEKENDLIIASGPPNWEGLLGCKGAFFTTADRLAVSAASFYKLNMEGKWESHNAKIIGPNPNPIHGGFSAAVHSNTTCGDSGTAYWNGKTILGIHQGASNSNHNIMSVIPPIPGITAPIYVYETTAPQGKIFVDVDYSIDKYIPKGQSWADADFDEDMWDNPPEIPKYSWMDEKKSAETGPSPDPVPVTKQLPSKKSKNGNLNGKGGTDRQPTGPASPSQKSTRKITPDVGEKDLVGEIVKSAVARIDFSKIEKMIAVETVKSARNPRKKDGSKQPKTSVPTSTTSTNGKYQAPHQRFPGSIKSEPYKNTITQNKRWIPRGDKNSPNSTPVSRKQ
uniref:Serine protease n=1 Tax=Geolu virus TaxID=2800917 RepID=A0A894KPB4_9VIRU|nr:MAG: serine protease [Geolu virus]